MAAGALLARRGYRVLHVDHDGHGTGYEDGGWRILGAGHRPGAAFPPRGRGHAGRARPGHRRPADARAGPAALQSSCRATGSTSPSRAPIGPPSCAGSGPPTPARLEGPGRRARPLRRGAAVPRLPSLLPPRGLARALAPLPVPGLSPSEPGAALPLADLGDHPLAAALRAAWPFLSFLDGPPSPLGLTRTLEAVLLGAFRPAGGEAAVAAMLRRRIAESRGELLGGDGEPAAVSALEVAGGKAHRSSGEERRGALRGPGLRLRRRAGGPGGLVGDPERLARWATAIVPAGRLVSLAMGGAPGRAARSPRRRGAGTARRTASRCSSRCSPPSRTGTEGARASPTERLLVAATRPRQAPTPRDHRRLRRTVAEFLPFLDRATVLASVPGDRGAPASSTPSSPPAPIGPSASGGVPICSPIRTSPGGA